MEDLAKRKKYLQMYHNAIYSIKNVPYLNNLTIGDCFRAADAICIGQAFPNQIQKLINQHQKIAWRHYQRHFTNYIQLYRLAIQKKLISKNFDIDPKRIPQQKPHKQEQKQNQTSEKKGFLQKIKDIIQIKKQFQNRKQFSSSYELKEQEFSKEQTSTSISLLHQHMTHTAISHKNLEEQTDLVIKLLKDNGWAIQIYPEQNRIDDQKYLDNEKD